MSNQTNLVGQEFLEGQWNYCDTFPTTTGNLCLLPCNAKKVVSFNPKTNIWKEIGCDLGDDYYQWLGGIFINENKIFCPPFDSYNILIIDLNKNNTDFISLPYEIQHGKGKFKACALDGKGNVLFFPFRASRIMKLEIKTNKISTIGINCGNAWLRAITASNGKIYVLSKYNYIMSYDPNSHYYEEKKLSIEHDDHVNQYTDIVEHRDGYLYSIPCNGTKVLKINMETLAATTVGDNLGDEQNKWKTCIVGNDDYVYGIPYNAKNIIRFDPMNEKITAIGKEYEGTAKWYGCCVAKDGNLYCSPLLARKILKIKVSRWNAVKTHVMLRRLVEKKRASIIEPNHCSCYQHFIQNTNDDVFRNVLQYL